MASTSITLDGSVSQQATLNQIFMSGGFNLVAVTIPAGGPWPFAPKDPSRRYISFSLVSGQPDCVAIPGYDNGQNGFTLTAANLPWEVGGNVMSPLVTLPWLLYAPIQSKLVVGFIRTF